jgi:hypothetical protein
LSPTWPARRGPAASRLVNLLSLQVEPVNLILGLCCVGGSPCRRRHQQQEQWCDGAASHFAGCISLIKQHFLLRESSQGWECTARTTN